MVVIGARKRNDMGEGREKGGGKDERPKQKAKNRYSGYQSC